MVLREVAVRESNRSAWRNDGHSWAKLLALLFNAYHDWLRWRWTWLTLGRDHNILEWLCVAVDDNDFGRRACSRRSD
jgi:hypothetical protein